MRRRAVEKEREKAEDEEREREAHEADAEACVGLYGLPRVNTETEQGNMDDPLEYSEYSDDPPHTAAEDHADRPADVVSEVAASSPTEEASLPFVDEAMAALEEPVVAVSPDVEVMAALEELVEVMVRLEELVAQVETMGPKLPKRKRKCVPCQCMVPGPCCGQQYSSQATLAVHNSKKHGDQPKADEKTAHEYALQSTNRQKRRTEDPEYREKERAKCKAYRAKKSLSHV